MEHSTLYFSWKSPSWLYRKRDKEFFRNVAAIVFLLVVILFFAREFPLILAVISVTFLIYVFSTVPPQEVEHKITSLGIESAGKFFPWDVLKEFWFETQWNQNMLVVVPQTGPRIIMLLTDLSEVSLKEVLSRFLPFQEIPQKTLVDNAASWLSRKVPLEKAS